MTLSPYAIILIPIILLLVILGFVTLNRYITYKERVELARLGFSLEDLNRDAATKRQGHRGVLWGGVMTAMSGLALLLGLSTLGMGAWLLGGLLPLFVGLGMVFIYFNTSGTAPGPSEQDDEPSVREGAEVNPFVTEREGVRNNGPDVH
ncbi:MAG TPA: hypothetical protein GX714_06790 [Chloroflexi bacterium]|jgi:hypothetical protein|nr:hypothetical protein [Chloroflexota bacterium]